MCGIFGYIGPKNDAAQLVFDGLKRLEYRGYDSWGVAVIPTSGKYIEVKKKIGKIAQANISELSLGTLSIGHTRWATHGGVTDANAHPHLDCTKNIAIIHNGIFEQFEKYKKILIKNGHVFISETDSEVIAHRIEDRLSTMPFQEAVRATFLEMKGLNAIIAIHKNERKLVAARQGSPLVIGFGKDENYLASDPAALLPHTSSVYFLEDGQCAVITDKSVEVFDLQYNTKVNITPQTLTWKPQQGEKGKYPYFMIKEIHEQPSLLTEILATSSSHINHISFLLKDADVPYFVGSGTSSYEALIGKYLFSMLWNKQSIASFGSEFSYDLSFLRKDATVLALSQSGETMDLLEPLKVAKKQGARIIALVNVLGSSLYRLADEKILVGAGPEKAVASTKAATAKIAHLILLTFAGLGKLDEGKKNISQAIISSKKLLSSRWVKSVQGLAKQLQHVEHIFVIGRGISYPVTLETALKIKEISYIHAEGLAAGELKHGTLALVEKGTPTIVYLPHDETYEATLTSAREMKARGAHIIGVSYKNNNIFDSFIHIEDAGIATIIPNVIFAQLLAYYLAVEKKLDPDMPRNLAKSVTVK